MDFYWCINHLYNQKNRTHAACPILKMNINGAARIFHGVSQVSNKKLGHWDA
jgi:hypothetical protein